MEERMLGHYRILEEIGQGGMGRVWKAFDTHLNRLVAIKALAPDRITSAESRRRFLQEAQSASLLNHPNIVTIHDLFTEAGSDYIVMEFVTGQTLDKLVHAGPLSENQVVRYAVQITDALAKAHAVGLIHRDIKPSNIMITGDGLVKLLDFGLAKLTAADPLATSAETATQSLTGPGAAMGTVAYMSPEQAQGRQLDVRSDVFSFGVVLYEMLSGKRPFHSDSTAGTLLAIVKDAPLPLDARRPDVAPQLLRILKRCLEKDREARFPSAAPLRGELEQLHQQLSSGAVPLVERLRRAAHRPRILAPALALAVVLIALGAWWGYNRARVRWAERVAIPQISELVRDSKYFAAFDLAKEAERIVPSDPRLQALWPGPTSA